MKYRGNEVKPTMRMVANYIKREGMSIDAYDAFRFWENKNWITQNGTEVKTLEAAINAYNGMKQQKKLNREKAKAEKAAKRKALEEAREREWLKFANEAYHVYTDGSCDNVYTKVGGAGYVILKDGKVVKIKNKGFHPTSNNRMEMLAIISALNSLPEGSNVIVFTDSQYCIKVLDGYMHQKNQDLINLFGKVVKPLGRVAFQWVKGHNGNKYNEMADELAFSAYKEMSEKLGKPISKWMLKTH